MRTLPRMHQRQPQPPWDAASLAQLLAAPLPAEPLVPAGTRRAAVLLLLLDVDGVAHTILTKRPDHLVHHPGQVSLPGGRYEPGDPSLLGTALRETHEEIGVHPSQVAVVRALTPVHTRVSGFLMTPFVGRVEGEVSLVPADAEIARIMMVPISEILDADARLPQFPTIATLRYPLDGEDVWGATARVLSDFSRVLRRVLRPVS